MTSSNQLQNISTLFDQWASSDRASKMANGHLPLMKALLAEIGSNSLGKSLLDLGCGTGQFLALATASGFTQTAGIDASPKMADISQKSTPHADIRIGSFEDLPWSDQQFDHVTSIEALYYCPDPTRALTEVNRVLKLGGRFDMIIDYYGESEGTQSWAQGVGFELTRWTVETWIDQTTSAGFTQCQTRRILNPEAKTLSQSWTESVWFPTQLSYENYLENGALWITALRSPSI